MNLPAGIHHSFLAAALVTLGLCVTHATAQPAPSPVLSQPVGGGGVITFDPDYPAAPVEGIYVSDRGVVLSIDQQTGINKAAALVKIKTGLPVMVVTIRSLEVMGADPAKGLDPYAREVFKRWATGTSGGDRAALLVLSRDDLQARLILGAGWPAEQQQAAQRLADGPVLTAVKAGRAGEGLLAAVGDVGAMFTAAGYTTDAIVSPVALPPGGGKIAADTPVPASVPASGGTLASVGPLTWIGIGVLFLVVVIFAAVLSRSAKRSDAPPS